MRIRLPSLITALALLPMATAGAEPQILGLLATDSATPLRCTEAECHAELTAFCMEPDRASPGYLTAYVPIPGRNDIRVLASTASGETVPLPAAALGFRTMRGFAAVRVSLPRGALDGIDAVGVSVEVGAKVTLRPVPLPTYRRPHEPEEVARTATSLREIGDRVVDRGGVAREITVLTNRLINALPERGKVDASTRLTLWDRTFSPGDLDRFSGSAVGHTRRAYGRCLATVEAHEQDTLRGCIWRAHDHQVWKLNHRYWNSLTGS